MTRRLVIVADNPMIVQAVRIGFRTSGEFNFVGHADGRRTSARTVLGARPDVILIDDVDRSERTIELIHEIRCENQQISLFVLSVQIDADWLERLFAAGATAAISKSAHPLALATLVRETLNGHIFHKLPGSNSTRRDPSLALAPEDLQLTAREMEILQLVASGATNGDVARRLWVTEQTVKFHLRNVYRKLGVANRTQASHFAYVHDLVKSHADPAVDPAPVLTVAS